MKAFFPLLPSRTIEKNNTFIKQDHYKNCTTNNKNNEGKGNFGLEDCSQ